MASDNYPMLRDGMTGDWSGTFIGHKGAVWQARLSGDGKLGLTGSADFSAKVWNTETGEPIHTLQHNHIVRAVSFDSNPSPHFLATGGAEKKLRIYDLTRSGAGSHATETNLYEEPVGYEIGQNVHQGTIKSIVWAPNERNILITAADDKKIRWWDLRMQRIVGEYEVDGIPGSCEISSASSSAAGMNGTGPASPPGIAGTPNGTSSTASESTQHPINGSTSPIGPSPSASVLSVAASKTVYFFECSPSGSGIPTPNQPPLKTHVLSGVADSVSCVAANVPARRFVTGQAGDTWVKVWDLDSGEELETGKGHHGPVWSVAFSPDGKLYASGSEDGTVKLWKFTAGGYGLWR
ncbi:MAG: hypothetical protein M1831_001294 [Alyxoria varia]|nr:MAG: hypothetical protein M1831_001294 [Alyxoria varia]